MHSLVITNTISEELAEFSQSLNNEQATYKVGTPIAFYEIRKRFIKAKKEGKRVLLENSDLRSANSVVLTIDYIGSRWCSGYQTVLYFGKELKIPYTIHYSDVYGAVGNMNNRAKRQVKVIFEGENPFE